MLIFESFTTFDALIYNYLGSFYYEFLYIFRKEDGECSADEAVLYLDSEELPGLLTPLQETPKPQPAEGNLTIEIVMHI
jgi:hypothetical protein